MVKPDAKEHLIVFGRYPRPGQTKTRLIPTLGPAGAAAVQKRLTERTLAAARTLMADRGIRLIFCHDGGDQRMLDGWLDIKGMDCNPQDTGDLGRRMMLAMGRAFDQGAKRVVLIGTDIPDLSAAAVKEAFVRLRHHDLVIGPSTDGGYWLVGLTRPANIFEKIHWSTPTVLQHTLALAERKGMTFYLLESLSDLDEPADLAKGGYDDIAEKPYLSVIIPTLNEERHISETLVGAASADAEIIVSDGGSTDRTVERARAHGARIVVGPRGRAGQQNRGAAAAGGEVLLFLHTGTRLPDNYVAHIFETLMNRLVVLGAFRFQTDVATPSMRWIAYWTNLCASLLQLPYGNQGLFLHRREFEAAGGFPDRPIAEDLYLVRRMARRGRIALASAEAVTTGRCWQHMGPLRTIMINTIFALGCRAGVAPDRLVPLYRLQAKKRQP